MNNFKITEELLKELFADSNENFIFYPENDEDNYFEVHLNDEKDLKHYEKIERMKKNKRLFEEWQKKAGF